MSLVEETRPNSIGEMILVDSSRDELFAIESIIKQDSSRIRAILLTGPSGYGKTTAARILAKQIFNTNDNNILRFNLLEINAADTRGIDSARQMAEFVSTSSVFSLKKVVIIDEAQQLTKEAQNCLLKPMEDSPNSCIIICSTDPTKLIPAIKTRCMRVDIVPFNQDDNHDITTIAEYLTKISEKNYQFSDENLFIEVAKSYPNSIRSFINKIEILGATGITKLDDRAKKLISDSDFDTDEKAEQIVKTIVRTVMDKDKLSLQERMIKYKEIISTIQSGKEQPETIRIRITAYTSAALARFNTDKMNINMENAFIALGNLLIYCTNRMEITKEQLFAIIFRTLFSDELIK